jgi:putative IMPACT (imprinted ancient) family translation regulator
MDNVLVVSVRYFGGIKLGAGGLVRAYTNSGNLVLDKATIVELVLQKTFRLEVEISLGNKVQDTLRSLGANILSCVYTDKLTLEFLGDYRDKLLQIYPTAKIELVGEKLVCEK